MWRIFGYKPGSVLLSLNNCVHRHCICSSRNQRLASWNPGQFLPWAGFSLGLVQVLSCRTASLRLWNICCFLGNISDFLEMFSLAESLMLELEKERMAKAEAERKLKGKFPGKYSWSALWETVGSLSDNGSPAVPTNCSPVPPVSPSLSP